MDMNEYQELLAFTPDEDKAQSWISPEEENFLEKVVKDPLILKYLFSREPLQIRFPPRYAGTYTDFMLLRASELERIHQSLRRIMAKSPYFIGSGRRAYCIFNDNEIPLSKFQLVLVYH